MSTIRDVAKEVGCSTATVSRALSNPEKVSKSNLKKINTAIEKLQYRPNMLSQQFRNKDSKTIIVMVPNVANLFFSTFISGIENIAQKKGYNVLLGNTKDDPKNEEAFVKLVETKQADGIIQLRPHREESLLPRKYVTAVNACGCENNPYPSVRIDNINASKQITDYLISLGHKNIGLITGLNDNPHTIERFKGYKSALESANIVFNEGLVAEGDFTMWSGLNACEHFTRMQEVPTAIVCMNDDMAIGLIKGLKAKGVNVPEDISVTGFDGLEFSQYCDPPLTTIAQPAEKLGEKSASLLFQLIEEEKVCQTELILPIDFIIRQSTTVPRN